MSKKHLASIALAVIILSFSSHSFAYPLLNGDFAHGLADWSNANTSVSEGIATLSDNNFYDSNYDINYGYSYISQNVDITPNTTYALSFDFWTGIQPSEPNAPWTFSDLFATSLYYDSASLPGLFDRTASHTELYNGTTTDISGAALSSAMSNISPDWIHFTYTFTTGFSDTFVTPTFELYDLNGVFGDGKAYISNIALNDQSVNVPEPSSLLLLGSGFAALVALRRYRVA